MAPYLVPFFEKLNREFPIPFNITNRHSLSYAENNRLELILYSPIEGEENVNHRFILSELDLVDLEKLVGELKSLLEERTKKIRA